MLPRHAACGKVWLMDNVQAHRDSLRPDRLEIKRLAWALAISIGAHGLIWGGYETGQWLGIWQKLKMPAWVRAVKEAIVKPPPRERRLQDSEPPMVFVEVNPAVSTAESPKDAKFYSDKNSQAANQTMDRDEGVPKITGTQENVARTEDVQRDVNRLQPTAPPQQPPQEESKPKPTTTMGDLALAKPSEFENKEDGQADRKRPKTLQEAMMRQQLNKIPGQQMKQEGGTRRLALVPSLDVKVTPFGAYDHALIEAVSQHWYNLLDTRNYASDERGRVVLRFRLKSDGTVSNMQVLESTVGMTLSIICQKAVLDPGAEGFGEWPGDMRRMVGGNYREITFTFFYN
jgi:hypothetical protein